MNELEFTEKHLGEYRIRGHEINIKTCPFCNGGRRNDKYKFFLNPEKHTYICHRGSCGAKGTFKELCELYREKADYVMEYTKKYFESSVTKKEYSKPAMKLSNISQQAQQYIKLRKISIDTAEHFNIKSDVKGNIVFPYYDEKGNHCLNKIRIPRKFIKGKDATKIWQEGNGKPILFGMDKIDITKPVIITEGEWDCMSVYESGVKNVVSIPFGTGNFDWVNECWEWLEQIKDIILWFDIDTAGQKALKEAVNKLGKYKCRIVNNDTKCKDANEILYKFGKDKINELVNKAEEIPEEHLVRISDVKYIDVDRMLFGIKFLDYQFGGCRMGELTLWTGKRGGGKSTILNQTIPEAVKQKQKVFIYSGELSNCKVKEWLDRQIAGNKYIVKYKDELTGREEYGVKPDIIPYISNWYKDYIYVYGDNGSNESEALFEVMEYAYKRHNVRRFILDNLKTIKVSDEKEYFRQQGVFVSRAKSFARKYNVHIDLVVHPRKTFTPELSDEDIGGSVDIIDLADNAISICKITPQMMEKCDKSEKEKLEENDTVIQILKNRNYGDTGKKAYYKFDLETKRIYGVSNTVNYNFMPKNNLREEKESEQCPF